MAADVAALLVKRHGLGRFARAQLQGVEAMFTAFAMPTCLSDSLLLHPILVQLLEHEHPLPGETCVEAAGRPSQRFCRSRSGFENTFLIRSQVLYMYF